MFQLLTWNLYKIVSFSGRLPYTTYLFVFYATLVGFHGADSIYFNHHIELRILIALVVNIYIF
jgi:hypothetical protein